jgi:electron transfer flavoprotein alpha subunit
MGNVLVFIEHAHGKLGKTAQVAVTAALDLAGKQSTQAVGAVLGKGVDGVAAEAAKLGLAKVIVVDDARLEHYLADIWAKALVQVAKAQGSGAVLATASAVGKDLLPRVAQGLDAGMASDIIAIHADGGFVRPTYAGNVMATVTIETAVKVVSVRQTAFPAAQPGSSAAPVEKVALDAGLQSKVRFVSFEETKSDRPELTDAAIVVSGGRGLKSGENFQIVLEPLVDALGAAMGASRAAVDAGFVPNDLQVGQTGKVVAPNLYIAVGISGAIQHLAGMKDSKVIVAINKDGDAPIFNITDYGLVADLFKAVPEMTEEVKKLKAS